MLESLSRPNTTHTFRVIPYNYDHSTVFTLGKKGVEFTLKLFVKNASTFQIQIITASNTLIKHDIF